MKYCATKLPSPNKFEYFSFLCYNYKKLMVMTMKKYTVLYLKRTAVYCFGIGVPICCLFFFVSLFADSLKNDLLISFYPLLVSFVIWCGSAIRVPLAQKLLYSQIKTLNVSFDDSNAEKTTLSSLTYLSDNWLIASGTLYLHKDFINKISVKSENKRNSMGGYYCIIKCKNGKKYNLFVPSINEYKTIKNWHKN